MSDAARTRSLLRRVGLVLLCARVVGVPLVFDQSFDQPFSVPKALLGHGLGYLLAAVLLALFAMEGVRFLTRSWLHIPVLFFLGASVLAMLVGEDRTLALFGAHARMLGLATVADWTVVYFAVALLVRTRAGAIAVLASVFGASIVVVLYEAVQAAGADPLHWSLDPTGRPFSTIGNATTLAAYLTTLAIGAFAIALLVTAQPRLLRAALLALVAALLVGTALTETRAAAIGLIVGGAALVILVWLKRPERHTARRIVIGAAVGTVGLAALLALSPIGTRLAFTFQDSAVDTTDEDVLARLEPSAAGRIALYRIGLAEFLDRPLLGYGPDSFVVGVPRFRPEAGPTPVRQSAATNAHSWIVQVGATTGAIGLLSFGAIAIGAVLLALRGNLRPIAVAGVATMAGFLGTAVTTVSDVGTDWLFWAAAGAVAAATSTGAVKAEAREANKRTPRSRRAALRGPEPRIPPVRYLGGLLAPAVAVALTLTLWGPADASRAAMTGTTARLQGRYPEAIEAGLRATRIDPGRAEYWDGLGLSYTRASAWRDATAAFDRARILAPYDVRYWSDLIQAELILAQAGDASARAKAIQLADEVVRRDPHNPLAHYSRALTMQVTGNIAEALSSVERALTLDPGSVNQRLYVTSTQVLVAVGRPMDAVRVARQGLEILGGQRRTTELRAELDKALAVLGLPPDPVPDPRACSTTRWTADPPSPQPAGTRVTFTVSATGCNQEESQIAIAGPDSTAPSTFLSSGAWAAGHTWDTTGLAPGTFRVYLYTRRASWTGTYQAFYEGTYVVSR